MYEVLLQTLPAGLNSVGLPATCIVLKPARNVWIGHSPLWLPLRLEPVGQHAGLWHPSLRVQNRPKPLDFYGRKNPQHAFLRRGSKRICPMSQLCGMSKNLVIYVNYELLANFQV